MIDGSTVNTAEIPLARPYVTDDAAANTVKATVARTAPHGTAIEASRLSGLVGRPERSGGRPTTPRVLLAG
jgi:hypothetical protein